MSKNALILFWILIVAVILLSTPTKCLFGKNKIKEGFYSNYGYYKRYCPNCSWKSRKSCSKCTNCGYCINASGYGECIPGDNNGPYFRRDCAFWEYGDPYYYAPYSHIYPVNNIRSIYPHYRWSLRNPRKWRKRRWKRKLTQ